MRLLDYPHLRQDIRAVLDYHVIRFSVRMSDHTHHCLGEESIFQSDGPITDAELLEVIGYRMDHPYLVFECDDVIEVCARARAKIDDDGMG